MKFHHVPTDENYAILKLASEDGSYEVGLSPVIYGVRIRGGKANWGCCDIDYCAGADQLFQIRLLDTVVKILEMVPDGTSSGAICRVLPKCDRKPNNEDPCWEKLQALSKLSVDSFLKRLNNKD